MFTLFQIGMEEQFNPQGSKMTFVRLKQLIIFLSHDSIEQILTHHCIECVLQEMNKEMKINPYTLTHPPFD